MRDTFRGKPHFRREDARNREMYEATCAECGNTCEVPFRPTGERPVFCKNCFQNKGGNQARGPERKDFRSQRPQFADRQLGDRQLFDAVCDSCGNRCRVPFRPTGDKPVYCESCFGKGDKKGKRNSESSGNDGMRKQLETVNSKLDTILKILSPHKTLEVKQTQEEVPGKEAETKKTKKPTKKKGKKK